MNKQQQAVNNGILHRYPVITETISFPDGGLDILRVREMDDVLADLTDENFKEDEQFPYWADLWPSAIALAGAVLQSPLNWQGQGCLELGCGLGLSGLAAARKGARVLATDYSADALVFARHNALQNSLPLATRQLDWRYPHGFGHFRFVLGADLLYEKRNHQHLLTALEVLLQPGGTAIFADPCRKEAAHFTSMATDSGWHLKRTETAVAYRERQHKIQLFELGRR